MLFKNKRCEKCGYEYDVTFESCPNCHQKDGNFENLGIPKNIAWLSGWQQIALFFAGFVYGGYLFFQLLYSSLLKGICGTEDYYFFLVISLAYVSMLIVGVLICIPRIKDFLRNFKSWRKYTIGLLYAVIVIVASAICGIITAKSGAGINQNQSNISDVLSAYPAVGLLVMGIIGPIVEEMTYRVGLYSFLRRLNLYVAIIVSSLIFALIHFNFKTDDFVNELLNLPSYIVAGVILAIAYERHGPATSMTAHIVYNLTSLTLSLITKA